MKKPNIVYILADDMGYGDVSCLNQESKIHTQHLDNMAKNGVVFTDAHSSSAVCTPSRYSILTGRYCWRSSLKQSVTAGYSKTLFENGRKTIADYLKNKGYATACFGKWHLGMDWSLNSSNEEDVDFSKTIKNSPVDKGFDEFFGIPASLDMAPYVYIQNNKPTAIPDRITKNQGKKFWREGPTAPDFVHEEVMTKITEKATEYIKKQAAKNQPFFVYFPLPAPHTPILPLPKFQGKTATNEYGDFCLQVDDTVGQIKQALDEVGITDETILIFTSDNGCSPMANFEELAALGHKPSYHFRGHKADIYEGGHRIPLLIQWPEKIPANFISEHVVCLTDFMATMVDYFGDQLPEDMGEDSVSNLPLWFNQKINGQLREATVHHSIDGSFSIRQKNWKLEMCPGSGGWSYPTPGDECEGLPKIQLYNLDSDIGEKKNVYEQHPDIVKTLTTLLTQYVKNGRSTPGKNQSNTGAKFWPQLNWLTKNEL